jgi:hypothetical protein
MIAGAHDEKTTVRALMDLTDAAFEQGRAVQRGDQHAAARHHRDSLAALDVVLKLMGESRPMPILDAVPE